MVSNIYQFLCPDRFEIASIRHRKAFVHISGRPMNIKLRSQVLESFQENQIELSISKIMDRLRLRFPTETAHFNDPDLNKFCRLGMDNAAKYEIKVEYNVYVFIVAMLFFGSDFDRSEKVKWNRDVLDENSMDEDLKTTALELQIAMAFGKAV